MFFRVRSSIEPNADGLIEMAAFVAALDPKKYSASAAAASSASPSLAKHPRKEPKARKEPGELRVGGHFL